MAVLSYPTTVARQIGLPVGFGASLFTAAEPAHGLISLAPDWRFFADTSGTITNNNRVMIKTDANAAEVPFAGARVRVHRLADGYCAWEGISDANGYYWPTGLEVGAEYYPVAIDLTRQHECDAAGPVVAVAG